MSTMNGNPHYEEAQWALTTPLREHEEVEPGLDRAAQIQATLALAFEQRTANLLALSTAEYANGSAMFPGELENVRPALLARLGLNKEQP